MSFFKRPVVWLWVLLTAASFWWYPRYELKLELELHNPVQQLPSLYYSENHAGFSADTHRYLSGGVAIGEGFRRYEAVIKSKRPIKMLRLDPLVTPGDVRIRSFVVSAVETDAMTMAQLKNSIDRVQQLAEPVLSSSGAELLLMSSGNDPYFTLKVNRSLYGANQRQDTLVVLLSLALLWGLVIGLWLVFQRWYRSKPRVLLRFFDFQHRIGSAISDEALIIFRPQVLLVLFVLALTFVFGVGLKINLSSLGSWDNYYKLQHQASAIALGESKLIRTDEWYVHSPWIFSQAKRGLPVDNSNIGPPGAALLVAVPVKHISMIAQPKYWGFLLFEVDRAYAWFWMTKAIGLLLVGFLLFMALTRNDLILSLAGAAWLYSSSYVQWWFSAFTPEVLTGFMASLLGAMYLFSGTRKRSLWIGSLILPLAMANLILHLYPAHIVPMAYLAVFLLVPLLWIAWMRGVIQPLLKTRVFASSLSMLVFAGLAYSVVTAAWPAIQSMMGTEYPGHRFSLGGGLSHDQLLMGFFEFWRDGYVFPSNGGNQSEAARFIFLFPVGLAVIWFYKHDKRLASLIAAATLYSVFCIFWMSWPLPESVRSVLAHIGWSYVPANRLFMGLGVASVFVAILTCQLLSLVGPAGRVRWLLAWTVTPLLLYLAWIYLRDKDPLFYNPYLLVVSVLIVGGMATSVLLGKRLWLLFFVLCSGWPSVQVNPILSGTDVFLRKTIFTTGADMTLKPNQQWAVFGNLRVAQGLRAQGVSVLNGVQYAPDHNLMRNFDAMGQSRSVWNRYANMGLTAISDLDDVTFELHNADLYIIKINPCHAAFEQLNVRYFAFANVGDPGLFSCLRPVQQFPAVDVYFYERVS